MLVVGLLKLWFWGILCTDFLLPTICPLEWTGWWIWRSLRADIILAFFRYIDMMNLGSSFSFLLGNTGFQSAAAWLYR